MAELKYVGCGHLSKVYTYGHFGNSSFGPSCTVFGACQARGYFIKIS